jgi:hypothetical protein
MKKTMLVFLMLGMAFSEAFATAPVYSEKATHLYLSQLSSMLVGRPLNQSETDLIKAERGGAIEKLVNKWLYMTFFADAAKVMVQTQLMMSGEANGVNHELPGNLAKYVVRNDLPYSKLLTADFCVDNDQKKIACDTGAPYSAGVLATRAYLISSYGRFNLGRAGKMMRYFACMDYPMDKKLQPPLKRERLIDLFQQEKGTGEDFGNGLACYTCHSQFGAHAQFFVKFDSQGIYQSKATGIQNPQLEAGKSFDGLNASHMKAKEESASEHSQMFTEEVSNLAGAAKVLARSEQFLECSIKNSLRFFLKLTDSEMAAIDFELVKAIASDIRKQSADPSLSEILQKALTNPLVVESVLSAGEKK